MKKSESLTIYGLSENIAFCEAKGLANCFNAYAKYASREEIMEGGIGFNANSGFVFIALENGVSIVSGMGQDCEYLYIDPVTDEETTADNYYTAKRALGL